MSAILLPFDQQDRADWDGFRNHVARTLEADLIPAVNMDTGYANLIDDEVRRDALRQTQEICRGRRFVAGAFVGDQSGDRFDLDAYRRQVAMIEEHGGTAVLMQSFGLVEQDSAGIVGAYEQIASHAGDFISFELGHQFAPFGRIYDLETYDRLMQIDNCIGAKHSSLHRQPEWDRLELRARRRPDFMVLTGNDLAIDMVMYGSDYLLGLSTFAPDAFALRDRYWQQQDPRFFELNDVLQYLGCFGFRPPVPAYKHAAAMFLHARGWIPTDRTHRDSPTRPDSDREVLQDILQSLTETMEA